MREPLPLAIVHDAVLEFLRGRDDAVVYGAQAVNAYVDEPRMTQDVDIASPRAAELAEELRAYLNMKFHIAVRVRKVRDGLTYPIYQLRRPQNRHLVDLRPVAELPPCQRVKRVLVVTPAELISNKVISMVARKHKRKGIMDLADLHALLLVFPKLKAIQGPVADTLRAAGASEETVRAWERLVATEILPEDEDAGY